MTPPTPVPGSLDDPSRVRYHGLDALRAVAMLMGLWLHGSMLFADIPEIPDSGTPRSGLLALVLLGIHGFRMQVFFAMAGFFAHLLVARRGWWPFAKNRGVRVGVPLAVGTVTVVPALLLLWSAPVLADGVQLGHLWFLRDLLLMYAGAFAVAALGAPLARVCRLGALRPALAWMIASRTRVLWLAMPASVLIVVRGELDGGPGEHALTPVWDSLLYYSLFFAAGWALYWCRERLPDLTRGSLLWTLLGVLVLFPASMPFVVKGEELDPAVFALGAVVYSLFTVAMVAGLTGLFLRWCRGESRAWRYIADSSYWLYLVHLPVQTLGAIGVFAFLGVMEKMFGWAPPGPEELVAIAGFLVVLALTTPPMLISYHWLVRPTPIGWVLNGRRGRPVDRASSRPSGSPGAGGSPPGGSGDLASPAPSPPVDPASDG